MPRTLVLILLILITGNGRPLQVTAVAVTETPIPFANLPVITAANVRNVTRLACLSVPDEDGFSHIWNPVWSPDGKTLAAIGNIRVWLFAPYAIGSVPRFLPGQVHSILGISRDSAYLVTEKSYGSVTLWDLRTGEAQQAFLDSDERNAIFRFMDASATIVASWGDGSGSVRLWNTRTGQQFAVLKDSSWPLAFSPVGTQLAVTEWAHDRVRIYDVKTLRPVIDLPHPEIMVNTVRFVTFSADGTRLAIGTWDEAVRVWDLKTGRVQATLPADYYDGVFDAVFSPDSKKIVTWGRTKVYLWNAETGAQIAPLNGHGFDHVGATFSPDGRLVASWDSDNYFRVRFWDSSTGRELHTIKGIREARFSPDGKLFATYGLPVELWGIGQASDRGCMAN